MECTQVLFSESLDEKEPVGKVPVATLQIEGNYHTIYNKENFIGRDDSCDIVIKNNAVSSKHAVVDAEDTSAHFIRDLSSTNKTKLGQVTLKPNVGYAIKDGDSILFGNVSATYNVSNKVPATPEKQNSNAIPETPEKENLNIIMESPGADEYISSGLDKSEIDMFDEKTRDSIMSTDVSAVGGAVNEKEFNDDNDKIDSINLREEFMSIPLSSDKPSVENNPVVIDDSDEETFISDSLITDVTMKRANYNELKNSSMEIDGECIEKVEVHQNNLDDINKEELETSRILEESFDVHNNIKNKGEQSPIDITSCDSTSADTSLKEIETNNTVQIKEQLDEDFFIPASQNEDIFESSTKDLNMSINNTFGSFSDSGDESMMQITTQQLKEELSVSDILPEEKDVDQHPKKLVEFLEPSSQAFGGNEEASVIRESVSEVDETLSSTVTSNICENSGYSAQDDKDLFSPTTESSMDEWMKGLETGEKRSENCSKNVQFINISAEHPLQCINKNDSVEKDNLTFNRDFHEAETQSFEKENDNIQVKKYSNQMEQKCHEDDNAQIEQEKRIINLDLSTSSDKCEKSNLSNNKLMEIDVCEDAETKHNEVKTQATKENKDSDCIKISESYGTEAPESSDIFKAPAVVNVSNDLSFTQGFYEAPTQPWIENKVTDNQKALNDSENPQNEATKISDSIKDLTGPVDEISDPEPKGNNKPECKLHHVSFSSDCSLSYKVVKNDGDNLGASKVTESSEIEASESTNKEPDLKITVNDKIEIKKTDLTFTEGFYEAPTQPLPEVKENSHKTNLNDLTESSYKGTLDTSIIFKEPSEPVNKPSDPEITKNSEADLIISDMTFTQGFYEASTQPWTESNDANVPNPVGAPEKKTTDICADFKAPSLSINNIKQQEENECCKSVECEIKTTDNVDAKLTDVTFTQGFYEAPTQPLIEGNDDKACSRVTGCPGKELTNVSDSFEVPAEDIKKSLNKKLSDDSETDNVDSKLTDVTFTQGFYEAPTQPWTEGNDDKASSGVTESLGKELSNVSDSFKVPSGDIKKSSNEKLTDDSETVNLEIKLTDVTFTQGFYEAPTQPWTEGNDDKASSGVTESLGKELSNVSDSFKVPSGDIKKSSNEKLTDDSETVNLEIKLTDATFTQGFYEAPTQPLIEGNDDKASSGVTESLGKELSNVSDSFKVPSGDIKKSSNEKLTDDSETVNLEIKLTDATFTQGFYEAPTQPLTEGNNDKASSGVTESPGKELTNVSDSFKVPSEDIKKSSNEKLTDDSETVNLEIKLTDVTFTQGFYEAPTQPFVEGNDDKASSGVTESPGKELTYVSDSFKVPSEDIKKPSNKKLTDDSETDNVDIKLTDVTFTQGFYEAPTQPWTEGNDDKACSRVTGSPGKELTNVSDSFEVPAEDIKKSLNKKLSDDSETDNVGSKLTDVTFTQGFYEAPTQPWTEGNDDKACSRVTGSPGKELTNVSDSSKVPSEDIKKLSNEKLTDDSETDNVEVKVTNMTFTQGFYEAPTQPCTENNNDIDSINLTESSEKELMSESISFIAPSETIKKSSTKKLSDGTESNKVEVTLTDTLFTQSFYEAPTQSWVENKHDSCENEIRESSLKETADVLVDSKTPSIPSNSISNPELTVHNKNEEAEINLPDLTFTHGFYEVPTQPWTKKDHSNSTQVPEKDLNKPLNAIMDDHEIGAVDKHLITDVLVKKDSFDEPPIPSKASTEIDENVSSLKNEESAIQKNPSLFSKGHEAPTQPFDTNVNIVKNASGDHEETSDKQTLNVFPSCLEISAHSLINNTKTNEESIKTTALESVNEDLCLSQSDKKLINRSNEYNTPEKETDVNSDIKININPVSQIQNKAEGSHEVLKQLNFEKNSSKLLPEKNSLVEDIKDLPCTQGFYEAETQPYIDQNINNDNKMNNTDHSNISSVPLNEIEKTPTKSDPKLNLINSKENIYDLDTEVVESEEQCTEPIKASPKKVEPNIYELDTEPYILSEPKKDFLVKDDTKPYLYKEKAEILSGQNEKLSLISNVPFKICVSKFPDNKEVSMDLSDSICKNSVLSMSVPKGHDDVDMSLSCINLPDYSLNVENSNKTDDKLSAMEKGKSSETTEIIGETHVKDINKNATVDKSDLTNDNYFIKKEEKNQEMLLFVEGSKKNKVLLDDSTDSSQEFNVKFQKQSCNVFPPDTEDLNDISSSSTAVTKDKPKNEKTVVFCSDNSENSSQELNIKFHKKNCNVFPPDTEEIQTTQLSQASVQNTDPINDKSKSLIVEDSENSSQEFNVRFQKRGCNVFPPDTQDLNELSNSSKNNLKDTPINENTEDLSNDSQNSSQELSIKFRKRGSNVFLPDTQEVCVTSGLPTSTNNVESNNENKLINSDEKSTNFTHESNLISGNNVMDDDAKVANESKDTSNTKKIKRPINKRSKRNLNDNSDGSSKDIKDDNSSLRRSTRSVKPFRKSSPQKNSTTNDERKSFDGLSNKRNLRGLRPRDSSDSQNDSQGSNFDYSEGDDLGRGKRKRVKTSFDGFVMEEDLKVYRKKSTDSPTPSDLQTSKSQRLSFQKETTIKGSPAPTSLSGRNLKIVLHDINSKPTTQTHKSPPSIISADDDDDLIVPGPSKKIASAKLNSTKSNSNLKQDTKSQNFSFCDKLDELFDIWGPADTVKLTPRAAKKTAKLSECEETISKRRRKNIFPEKSSDMKEDIEKPSTSQSRSSKSTVRKTSKEKNTEISQGTKISPKHKIEELPSEAPVEKKPRKKISEPEPHVTGGISLRVTRTSNKKKSDTEIIDNTAGSPIKELSNVSPPKRKKISPKPDLLEDNSRNILNDNKSRKGKPTKKTNQSDSKNMDHLNSINLSSPTDSYPAGIMPSQEFSFYERATKSTSVGAELKTPPEIRRSSRSKKPEKYTEEKKVEKVMFTGFTDRKLTSIVSSLGGEVVESPFTCTVLVTDKVKRTTKFLSALSRGLPIVTPDWLHASSKAGKFSDFEKFIVSDKEAEKKFSFSLKDSLKKSSSKKLLDGWSIFVTSSVKPPPEEIKSIVECSGGKFLSREPARWMPNTLIISSVEDKSKWNALKKRGKAPPIVGTEALFSGILQQKLDIRSHSLV